MTIENAMPTLGKQRFILIIIGMLLLAGVIIVAILQDRFIYSNQWQVSVVGEGRVDFIPDTVLVTLGVKVDKAPTAPIALDRLNSSIEKVIPALIALGISEQNIETRNFYLAPHYDVSEFGTNPSGYNANQQIVVKIEGGENTNDLVSKAISEANKNGVNQVLDVTFTSSHLEDLKQQARLLALADASEKAVEIADSMDVELKRIVGWWDNMITFPGQNKLYGFGYGGGEGGGGYGVPMFPEESQEVIVQMSVTYLIR